MLFAIILIPFLTGFLSFRLKDRWLWLVPFFLTVTAGLFAWESYLLYISGQEDVPFSIPFLTVADVSLSFDFRFDFTSMVMGAMVLSVSILVLLYTLDFFHEAIKPKFFGLLTLFSAAMMVLVFADNLVSLYLGWEGVSIVSYFVIGIRSERIDAGYAALKAFIINRIGDVFFLFALIMLFCTTKALDFKTIFDSLTSITPADLRLITVFLLIGVFAKSAQIGFHVWLPDAMVAPTSASALLHSSTMVVAGVYVVIRLFLLFELVPSALQLMMWVGAASALYGAVLATVQSNIKKIVAYSTISQIGIMLVLLGLGYPMLAFLYLLYHGFYKALMFLDVGAVIRGLSTEHDVNKMGGLYRVMPFAYAFMWVSVLAVNSVPLLAGYYAKEAMLFYANDNPVLLYVLFATFFFTAGYSFRMLLKVFHGKPKEADAIMARIHENNPLMIAAMFVLVVLVGVISFYGREWFVFEEVDAGELLRIAFLLTVLGFASAFVSGKIPQIRFLKRFINDRRDFAELYKMLFIKPVYETGKFLFFIIDNKILGGIDKFFVKAAKGSFVLFGMDVKISSIYGLFSILGMTGIIVYVMHRAGML